MSRIAGPAGSEEERLLHKFYTSAGTMLDSCSRQDFFKRDKYLHLSLTTKSLKYVAESSQNLLKRKIEASPSE